MNNRKVSRTRRATRTRHVIRLSGMPRLSVHRTSQHIYAQVIEGDKVLASASTLEKSVKADLKSTSNIAAAEKVGQLIAERAAKLKIEKLAFDRSGFKYHGRVKAVAEQVREKKLLA